MSIKFQGYSLPGERDSKGLKEGREKDGERANVSTGISNRPFRYYLLEYAVGVVGKEITSERRDGIRRFWKFLSEREVKLRGSNRFASNLILGNFFRSLIAIVISTE